MQNAVWHHMWKAAQTLVAGSVGVLTLSCKSMLFAGNGDSYNLPPFKARLTVKTSQFSPGAEVRIATQTSVTVSYSNTWWRIDSMMEGVGADKATERVYESCMSIPEGTRYIVYAPDAVGKDGRKLTGAATACPLAFPSPGHEALFVTWLTLCPKPKLPTIDSMRMRRFIYIPECEIGILNDARNLGTYVMAFNTAGGNFLSHLQIKNDGADIQVKLGESGFESVFHRFPPPFDKGFLEFEFLLLDTTNYHGVVFPARAVARRFYPAFDSVEPTRLFTNVVSEIQIVSITSLYDRGSEREILPSQVVASDLRPAELPNGAAVNYLVTNDIWKTASDPQIKALVNKKRLTAVSTPRSGGLSPRGVILGTMLIVTAIISALTLRRLKPNRKTQEKKGTHYG